MKYKISKMNPFLVLEVLSISIVVVGITIIIVSNLSNKKYENVVEEKKDDFITNVNDDYEYNPYIPLYEELQRRNENLYIYKQNNLVDPFFYQQTTIDLSYFGLKDNIIGYISIPKMNVEMPILLGANKENLEKGAVHLTETSYPIGGENTNSVIAAHRGGRNANMFRDIEKLEIGDEIYIQNFREKLVYQVVKLKVILPTDIFELLIQEGRDLVTLVTCHPYGQNSRRYVVYAERVKSE